MEYKSKIVEFPEVDPDMVREFYSLYDIDLSSEPNETGWLNFKCPLPTHGSSSKKPDGGICLKNMHYRCWSNICKEEYNQHLMEIAKEDPKYIRYEREWLSPEEFLMIAQDMSYEDAQRTVEDYTLSWKMEKSGGKPEKFHLDNHTNKKFISSIEWENFAKEAQENLLKNKKSDILNSYMIGRGLRLETVLSAKMGYVPASRTQRDECLVHIYYSKGKVVGIKGRTLDSRKGGVKNSSNTLYLLQDLQKALTAKISTIILCEGETDALVMRQALNDFGYEMIPCCGLPGSNFPKEWSRFLKYFTRIIFIRQSDAPSKTLGDKIIEAMEGKEVEILEPPFEPLDVGKDISDYFMLNPNNMKDFIDLLGLSTQVNTGGKPKGCVRLDILGEYTDKEKEEWFVTGLIRGNSINLIVGAPKVGKSFLGMQMAFSTFYGVPFMGNPYWTSTGKFKCVLLEGEDSDSTYVKRMRAMVNFHKLSMAGAEVYLSHNSGIYLDTEHGIMALRKLVLKEKPDLLIIDPLASVHNGNENDSSHIGPIMNKLRGLLNMSPGMAIVLVHHAKKKARNESGPSEARGSSALFAAVEMQMVVDSKRVREDRFITLDLLGRFSSGNYEDRKFKFNPSAGMFLMEAPEGGEDGFRPTLVDKVSGDMIFEIFLRNPTNWYTTQMLADLMKTSKDTITRRLKQLITDEYITAQKIPDTLKTMQYKLKEK